MLVLGTEKSIRKQKKAIDADMVIFYKAVLVLTNLTFIDNVFHYFWDYDLLLIF